jgi:hypothetical protein
LVDVSDFFQRLPVYRKVEFQSGGMCLDGAARSSSFFTGFYLGAVAVCMWGSPRILENVLLIAAAYRLLLSIG